MRPSFGNVSAYCQSSAGYTAKGIPSLDSTFGWQSGTFSGGTRMTDGLRFATWSANATGRAYRPRPADSRSFAPVTRSVR